MSQSDDLISRQSAIDAHCELCSDRGKCPDICPDVEVFRLIAPAQPDLSTYSDKLWRTAYERGKREAQQEQGDEASFWKKCAREYEDIIADLVAEQAKGIKLDSITITEEGITFKKSQPERKRGKWINVNEGKWNVLEVLKCSACGEIDNRMYKTDSYCPNCGADMRGGDEK